MNNKKFAAALRDATYAAWMGSLAGHKAAQDRFEIMRNPKRGDWVVEMSTIHLSNHDELAVGKLLRTVREPHPNQQPDEFGDESVTYIEGLDGTETRWVNCQFVAIPKRVIIAKE